MSNDAEKLAKLALAAPIAFFVSLVLDVLALIAEPIVLMLDSMIEVWSVLLAPLELLGPIAAVPIVLAMIVAASVVRETIVTRAGTGPTLAFIPAPSSDEPELSETEQTIEESVEDVRERYVEGEIDEIELELQLDRVLDPGYHEIRELVEDASGVGPELSEQLAVRFDDVDELRDADVEDLQRVSGIGEQRAEAIREQV